MKSFSRFLTWLDENILILLGTFLLAFVPLYPKIPLWSPIEQYIVRVRLEDIFILLAVGIWLVQVLRRKVAWRSPMFWVVAAYGVVGLVSSLVAMFVIKTVPLEPLHVGKTFLHYFRYLEYFSLFFILFSAIKKRSQVVLALGIFSFTVLAVSLYGYGQRYYFWPVYSTMNREFSKGIRLYLTEHARVQSTFAGHYDMSAFLVITLPLILALAYRVKRRRVSLVLHLIFWVGTWLLILSASRTPFAAYFAAVLLVIGITGLLQKNWLERIRFVVTRTVLLMVMLTFIFYYFGADMIERLSFVAKSNPITNQIITEFDSQRKMILPDSWLSMLPTTEELNAALPKSRPPQTGISTDDVAAAAAAAQEVASKSDQPPSPINPTAPPKPTPAPSVLPAGVYVDVPDLIEVATVSATGETVMIQQKRKRVYSECALKKELSLCIRQETLWPRAMEGFLTNPITGSGYATLTKESIEQFTEADSTDNNFLRTLGETGILGFVSFYGAVVLILFFAVRNITSKDWLCSAFSVGMFCGSIGLLLNAVYIDVFAASKVAQTYWALAGVFFGYLALDQQKKGTGVREVKTSLDVPQPRKKTK